MNSDIKYSQSYDKETHLEQIECILPKGHFDTNFKEAVTLISQDASAPGFRKGNVPENVVLTKYTKEISDKAIALSIDEAVKNIGEISPRPLEPLHILSVTEDEGALKIIFTYVPMPTVTLPDFTKIKVAKKDPKQVTEEEINNEIRNIWFHYAKELDKDLKKEDFSEDKIDEKFFEKTSIKKDNPEIKNFADLKDMIGKFIQNTYEKEAEIDWEKAIRTEIVKAAKFEKVEALIERELEKRVENYKDRFRQIGMDPEEYLTKNNVNLEDLKKDWKVAAEQDVKFEIVLQKSGEENKFQPTEEEINEEIKRLDPQTKKQYKNDPSVLKSLIVYYYINQKAYNNIFDAIRNNSK
jgi:FKBP-type peptidyl-prolyl cis-trans isomerase (trigger factor)